MARNHCDDARRLGTIFDFWARASGAYRFDDGTHQAADAQGHATPYRAYVDEIVAACQPIADPEARAAISRLNALLTSYLFLLWFDTRSGYQDTGPYVLPDGRVLLLRAYNRLGVSHFPWSAEVSSAMPHTELLGAFVLDGAQLPSALQLALEVLSGAVAYVIAVSILARRVSQELIAKIRMALGRPQPPS